MTQSIQMMNVDQAREFIERRKPEDFTLLDVRQAWEYEEFHLPGAILIPLTELADRLGEIDTFKPVLAYCASGGRSMAAATLLEGHGYKSLINMVGGAMAWNGQSAFGPMELGMVVFSGSESVGEIIGKAYAMENTLQGFYARQGEQAETPEQKDLFMTLAGFEDRHKKTLFTLYKKAVTLSLSQESFEKKIMKDVGGLGEGGVNLEEFVEEFGGAFDDEHGILQLASMIEAQAMDYYIRCARRAESEETKEALQLLAREEKAHLRLLGKQMDRLGTE
ncbi:rhodanese-like domain-containing protein [Pseudodesulfovibrio piezophilus]|uniref:Rhodanese domain protein n=1 Tax=Pseudodesulfovibrio piezophilus (strain DSM 21447 / JCM 15486 / C1TLV30) TaxID=1322246 RepID=M1WLM4_PSEP2|nr:rhodanese-like domain-containing protein [Pseudodesulfovibrio piezophilus]CCH48115.1 Rhodanese domain protein [Pseudodesulfovibrio piezophilus C1TLV30]